MKNHNKQITLTPKEALISRLNGYIEERKDSKGYSTQVNVIFARTECLPALEALSDADAEATHKAILDKEAYDVSKDKFGWGPVTISPIDFIGFIPSMQKSQPSQTGMTAG